MSNKTSKEKLIQILKQILLVEDIEVKNCAIESLIETLEEELNGVKREGS